MTNRIQHWYASKTLMGFGVGEPDRNKRILTHHDKDVHFVFNDEMKEWSDKDSIMLQKLVNYLNEREKSHRETIERLKNDVDVAYSDCDRMNQKLD